MGFTVVAMNKTFFHIDVNRYNCLYLLPTKTPDATDFSATRFDPLLELSPHLTKLFSDVKNVATKRAGSATLYIRGANSRSGLKSIPVSFIVFDEFDEMNQDNIPLAIERTSGQLYKQFWAISTPTVPEHGINGLFLDSTQEHFMFPCPLCQRMTELVWPDSLVICGESATDPDVEKSHIICKECKGTLRHEGKSEFFAKGEWIPFGHSDYNIAVSTSTRCTPPLSNHPGWRKPISGVSPICRLSRNSIIPRWVILTLSKALASMTR